VSFPCEGGCSCGGVRYRVESEPLFTHCCHCLNCQRQTGSAFVINLLIEADRVKVLTGAPEPVEVPRDDGSTQTIYRCPRCQIAAFSRYSRPDVLFVRGGTLDDRSRASSGSPDSRRRPGRAAVRSASFPCRKLVVLVRALVLDQGRRRSTSRRTFGGHSAGLLEVGGTGLEPVTPSLSSWCSPN
jgi:hypothetical protein